jgi:hypothetical protein
MRQARTKTLLAERRILMLEFFEGLIRHFGYFTLFLAIVGMILTFTSYCWPLEPKDKDRRVRRE